MISVASGNSCCLWTSKLNSIPSIAVRFGVALSRYNCSRASVSLPLVRKHDSVADLLRDLSPSFSKPEDLEGRGEQLLDLAIRLASDSEWRKWLSTSLTVAASAGESDV